LTIDLQPATAPRLTYLVKGEATTGQFRSLLVILSKILDKSKLSYSHYSGVLLFKLLAYWPESD
jgi:hypothetical protein